MLPRVHRLTRREHFAAAVRRGRRVGTATVVLHLHAGTPNSDTPPRVGFVVGKSVGNAVIRNRVKRRLRHLVSERLTSLPTGSLLVVRALPAAASASSRSLATDLDRALRRLLTNGRP